MGGMQNIQIPLPLFEKLVGFFEMANLSDYRFPALYNFDAILLGLRKKQRKINLRALYTEAVLAKGPQQKQEAYANYTFLDRRQFPT